MSGMAPDFDITLEGKKPCRVSGKFADITAFERWAKTQPGPPTLQSDPMTFAAFCAWKACIRDGLVDAGIPLEAFEGLVVSLDPVVDVDVEADAEMDPTR